MTNKIKKFHKKVVGSKGDHGGAAFEYILVSIFGLLVSVAAIGFLSGAMEAKLSQLESQLGISFDFSEINPFQDSTD